ncbi:MAG: hypothetical protein KGM42_19655 [Hyphomicrobiales bacterium]|nr:hypothetical protein [Hyphomicrobiales bacterium]
MKESNIDIVKRADRGQGVFGINIGGLRLRDSDLVGIALRKSELVKALDAGARNDLFRVLDRFEASLVRSYQKMSGAVSTTGAQRACG